MPRGTIFPPNFATPEALGFQWASEGDLVSKMQATHGDEATIAAFKAHRDAYLQQTDLDKLKSLGYAHVRLPVTWACFFGEEGAGEAIVADPAHPDVKQVTVSRAALDGYVATLAAAGMDVLIDVHNMPGGSSLGTYNGGGLVRQVKNRTRLTHELLKASGFFNFQEVKNPGFKRLSAAIQTNFIYLFLTSMPVE